MTPEEKNLLKKEAEKAKAQKNEQKLFKKLFEINEKRKTASYFIIQLN